MDPDGLLQVALTERQWSAILGAIALTLSNEEGTEESRDALRAARSEIGCELGVSEEVY